MTLKRKSFIISFGSTTITIVLVSIIAYVNILSGFQGIENQRVERNNRRVLAIINDKSTQLKDNLSDWTIWDDTYVFLQDRNTEYMKSNISQESFISSGVDEALFINKKGALVASLQVDLPYSKQSDFPNDVMRYFATGSALLHIQKQTDFNKGIIKVNGRVLMFAARSVVKSDGTGDSQGWVIFLRHFDEQLINSMKELTQFGASITYWDAANMPTDFQEVKREYLTHAKNSLLRKSDRQIIYGYQIIEDYFGRPQIIVKSGIKRDISMQGKASIVTLMMVLIGAGLIVSFLNFRLMNDTVLKKIFSISSELEEIGNINISKNRLSIGEGSDEISILRKNINSMLEDIESSHTKLAVEVEKRESLIEMIDSIVVMLDESAHIIMINQYGCDILGYTKEELLGKDWIETLIIPEEQEMIKRRFFELMHAETANNSYIEHSILTKKGTRLVYGWHNTVMRDAHGIPTSTLRLGNDISQEKEEKRVKEEYTQTLQRMNDAMIGRELKMIELKKRIIELENAT